MLTTQSLSQTVKKLERLCNTLYSRLFMPVGEAEQLGLYETKEALHGIPAEGPWSAPGARWGGEGVYGWFRFGYCEALPMPPSSVQLLEPLRRSTSLAPDALATTLPSMTDPA